MTIKFNIKYIFVAAALLSACVAPSRTPDEAAVRPPSEVGMASWYGADLQGQSTANGETFDHNSLSAAHRSLPLPSLVEVTNKANGRKLVVRVNDRGPFAKDRVIDVSRAAAEQLDFVKDGETQVELRYLGPAPAAGAKLQAALDPSAEGGKNR